MRCFPQVALLSVALVPLVGAGPTTSAPAHEAVERFYSRMLGDWVGTSVTRLQGQEPATSYFHLAVTRPDPRTYREEFQFFRRDPKTGALAPCGTQTSRALLQPDGRIRCEAEASGTVLIDLKPRKQSWQTSGPARCEGADCFLAEVSGRISVEGTPLGVGKRGRIRTARATWTLQGETLTGRTEVESRFRALIVTKKYRVVTDLQAERGRDLRAYVSRVVGARAAKSRATQIAVARLGGLSDHPALQAGMRPTSRRSASSSVSSRFGKANRIRSRPSL